MEKLFYTSWTQRNWLTRFTRFLILMRSSWRSISLRFLFYLISRDFHLFTNASSGKTSGQWTLFSNSSLAIISITILELWSTWSHLLLANRCLLCCLTWSQGSSRPSKVRPLQSWCWKISPMASRRFRCGLIGTRSRGSCWRTIARKILRGLSA